MNSIAKTRKRGQSQAKKPKNVLSSYRKDAVNLLTNRIKKKLREVFQTIMEFAAF